MSNINQATTLIKTYTASSACLSKHFFDAPGDGGKRKCKLCTKSYTANRKTTTNLVNHLMKSHTIEYETAKRKRDEMHISSTKRKKPNPVMEAFDRITFQESVYMDKIGELLVSCDEPFALVERPQFRGLMEYMKPGVYVPNRRKIRGHVMAMFSAEKENHRQMYSLVKSKFSFTSDVWTAPNQKSFMAITCHYLTENFQLRWDLLDFIPMEGSHTGSNIGQAFRKSLDDFGITKEKVFAAR
jgi:hypothetical protein